MPLTRRAAFATLLCSAAGCDLFRSFTAGNKSVGSFFADLNSADTPPEHFGPVLQLARLESCVPRGPRGDQRILQLAWEELDESGVMGPEQRRRLNDAGLRVGVAGSSTPWILKRLAQEAGRESRPRTAHLDASSMNEGTTKNSSFGVPFQLLSGGNSFLDVQSGLNLPLQAVQQIPQLQSLREAGNLRCTIEARVEEIYPSWVEVSLMPVVYTGRATPRLTIVDQQEQLPIRQNQYPVYELQMKLRLMPGEIIVIGRAASETPNTVGRLFFSPETGFSARESLLMVQLTGIDQLQGHSDPGFRPGQFNK
jgi:hypothetical protein